MIGTKWFDGAMLNYTEHIFNKNEEQPAIIYKNETDSTQSVWFRD